MPAPPALSGMQMPVRPISPNCFHRAVPKPSVHPVSRQWRSCLAILPSSARKPRAVSCIIFWSSVSNAMSGSRQARECAWRRCRAGSRSCRPRSNWPWCAASRAAPCRPSIARCPIRARRDPPAAMISSWRRLFSSVPAYFIIEGMAGCASPAFNWSMKRSLIAEKASASTSKAAISARSIGSSSFGPHRACQARSARRQAPCR